jgi:hypothetical protein
MRGPSGRTQRSRSCAMSRNVRPCAAGHPRLRREHRQAVRSSVWRPDWHQHTFWRLRWDRCLDLLKISPQMVDSKDHTDISPDNILKSVIESLTVDEQQKYEDYMRQANEKFLSQYTVYRHQKVVKHGETDVTSLLSSLQVPNVSKPDNIQSIKQYVDHQQNQMKQRIGGLKESIRKLTRSLEKSVVPSFLSYETSNRISMSIHRQQMGIRSPNHYMVCR